MDSEKPRTSESLARTPLHPPFGRLRYNQLPRVPLQKKKLHKIKRIDGEVIVGEKVVVEGEPTGAASNSSYLPSTPTVTVQEPTPTLAPHTNEKGEPSDPQSLREAGASTEDDVDMHDIYEEGYDGPGKKRHHWPGKVKAVVCLEIKVWGPRRPGGSVDAQTIQYLGYHLVHVFRTLCGTC